MNEQKVKLQSADELKKPVRQRDPKKGRTLLLALGGIVLLAALALGVTWAARAVVEYVELNTDHTVHLTDYTADQVLRVEIRGKTAVTITRRAGVYTVRELSESVTSQSACENAFANAATLLAESVAAEHVTDFAPFGLDDPISTVTIAYTDRTMTLEIGGVAPASQHYYVRVDGGDTVYLMRPMLVSMFADGIAAYRDISGFAVSSENLTGFLLETGKDVFEMQYHDRIGGSVFSRWQMVRPARNNTDGAAAEALAAGVEGIALSSFVKTAREDALDGYGLDAPWRTLTLTYADGSTFTMELGETDSLGNLYARFDGTNDVYLVKKESVSFLDGVDMPALINEFANIVAINSVDALDVTLDGVTLHYTIDRTGDEPAFALNGAAVDAERFKEAFQTTNVVPVNGFAEDEDVQGAQSVLTLTYTFNNGEEPYTVEYLDYSINNCALRKNGSVSVTVSKEALAGALELWRALR